MRILQWKNSLPPVEYSELSLHDIRKLCIIKQIPIPAQSLSVLIVILLTQTPNRKRN